MNAPERPPTCDDAMTPPFFTASVSSASAAMVPGRAGALEAHLLEDLRHRIADGRRRRQRRDRRCRSARALAAHAAARGSVEPPRDLAADELAGARDLERHALDGLGDGRQVHRLARCAQPPQRRQHDARAGAADVDHAIALAHAVHRAGDERVVVGDVGERAQLGAADAALARGALGQLLDHAAHDQHGVHVDAGARGRHVHRRADPLRHRERLGDRVDQRAVARGHRPSRPAPRSRRCSRCPARRRRGRASTAASTTRVARVGSVTSAIGVTQMRLLVIGTP